MHKEHQWAYLQNIIEVWEDYERYGQEMMEEHLAEIIVWGVEDQCNERLKMVPEGD